MIGNVAVSAGRKLVFRAPAGPCSCSPPRCCGGPSGRPAPSRRTICRLLSSAGGDNCSVLLAYLTARRRHIGALRLAARPPVLVAAAATGTYQLLFLYGARWLSSTTICVAAPPC